MYSTRSALLALAATALFALAAPAAQATVTQTNITSPANHAVIVNNDVTGEPNVTVTGTAPGASDGDTVDILCTRPTVGAVPGLHERKLNTKPIVVSGQAFSFMGSFAPIEGDTCVLRAVPAGTIPADLTPFTGPQLAIDENTTGNYGARTGFQVVGGPNNGALTDYFFWGAQFHGTGEYLSISSCGLCDSYAVDPTTSVLGGEVFFANAALFDSDIAEARSEIQIDGNNAFASAAAQELIPRKAPATFDGSQDYENFPHLSFNPAVNPLTGDVNIGEEGTFSHCVGGNPFGGKGAPNHANCSNFAGTGVSYSRQIIQNQDGGLASIVDTFTSTDGAPHQLDLLYYQSVKPYPTFKEPEPGYQFPWISGAFVTPSAEATIPAPPGPATIFVKGELKQAEGDETRGEGGLVLSAPPNGIKFGKEPTEFELHYIRTIPAGGSIRIGQAFATAFTLAGVESLAQGGRAAFDPTVAISSPSAGATVSAATVTVTGSVTAGGNNLPGAISVNGKSVPVSATGAWSAQVPLTAGANTITAVATDEFGLSGSASVHITSSPPPAKAVAKITHASYDGKDVLVTIACTAGGSACEGSAKVTAKEKVKVKTRRRKGHHARTKIKTITITVASGGFSIPAGKTETIALKVGKTANSLIAGLGRLASTITLALRQPDHSTTTVVGHLTLVHHKAKRKHKRHRH